MVGFLRVCEWCKKVHRNAGAVLAWSGHDERASIEAIFLDSRRKLFRVCQVCCPAPFAHRTPERAQDASPARAQGREAPAPGGGGGEFVVGSEVGGGGGGGGGE